MSRSIAPADGAAWTALFEGVRESAFRLEGLQTYSEPLEAEAIARFLSGKPHGLDTAWWRSMVRGHSDAGRHMQRVRIVTEPLTDYTRFELTVYPELVAAGEDIRVLTLPSGQWPDTVPQHDYWLVDDQDLWLMRYDTAGHFLGADLMADESVVSQHRRWRDVTLAESVPLPNYLRTLQRSS